MLAFETNVISFVVDPDNTLAHIPSPVLGSQLVSTYVSPYGADGWVSMDLASGDGGHQLQADTHGIVLAGLPVTGFMVYNVINANAQPGLLANYNGVFPHRSTIACSSSQVGTPACQ